MSDPIVPKIDLLKFLYGTAIERSEVVNHVRNACENIGFLTLHEHEMPLELIRETRQRTEAFFSKPAVEKEKCRGSNEPGSRGYSGLAEIGLSYSLDMNRPPDLHEAFTIGPDIEHNEEEYFTGGLGRQFFLPNIWPESPSFFQQTMTRYYQGMKALASQILSIFALALDLDEDFFSDKTDKAISSLRLIHYPAQSGTGQENQIRAGEHTDFGTLTILHTDQVPAGGLQVYYRGGWHDVIPPKNGFIINIGDLMAQWTNDKWISTLHRVMNPPANVGNYSRYSLVYFQQPNYDAEIKCLKSCVSPNERARYANLTSGEHWLSKIKKTRQSKTC